VEPVIPQEDSVDNSSILQSGACPLRIEEQSTSQIIRQIRELQNAASQRPHLQQDDFPLSTLDSGDQDEGTPSSISQISQPLIINSNSGSESSQIAEHSHHSEMTVAHSTFVVVPDVNPANSNGLTPDEGIYLFSFIKFTSLIS
jgi:hypothetical protein